MSNNFLQVGAGLTGLDQIKIAMYGFNAVLLYRLFVHAGRVVVANKLIGRAALCFRRLCGGLFEDAVQHVLVCLTRFPTAAPAHHACRNGIVLTPGAIGIIEKIHARVDGFIYVANVDAMQRRSIGGENSRGEREHQKYSF